jgi:molybdate transport system ATP-binding protein
MSVPHLDIELSGDAYGRRFDFTCHLPLSGVTVITGPSGAGKSTLLRCLAGLSRLPGRIRVGGETWQEGRLFTPPHEREVGFVFQDTRLWPHMTVRETLNYAVRRARRAVRLGEAETIGLLGLAPLLDRAATQLSGGEQQRVAIGRAILSQPALLLLDEPTAGLDRDHRAEMMGLIARLTGVLDTPVLYVTHDAVDAVRLADRRIEVAEGRITGVVMERPADPLEGLSTEARDGLARAALAAGLPPA